MEWGGVGWVIGGYRNMEVNNREMRVDVVWVVDNIGKGERVV